MITSRYCRGALASAGLAVTGGLLANLAERTAYTPLVNWLTGTANNYYSNGRLGSQGIDAIAFVLTIPLFLFFLWLLSKVAGEALDARARVTRIIDPRPVLIVGLAWIPKTESVARLKADAKLHTAETLALPKDEFLAIMDKFRSEGRPLPFGAAAGEFNPWQQLIRAMWANRESLTRVIVLPSKESLSQFESFRGYATGLFHNSGIDLTIDYVRDAPGSAGFFSLAMDDPDDQTRDYEAYEYVDAGLRQAIRQASADGWTKDRHICIDATAGQKTFSIAAAIVTLNTKVVLSYVNNHGLVSSYDLGINVLADNRQP